MAFPQELVELFLEELADDMTALDACSHVSRAFKQAAQSRYFRTVRIASYTRAQQLSTVFDASPRLAGLVRSVISHDHTKGDRWVCTDLKTRQGSIVLFLLPRMINVHTLHVDFGRTAWRHLPEVDILKSLFCGTSPSLRTIAVEGIYMVPSLDHMLSWFAQGHVVDLELSDIHPHRAPDASELVSFSLPFLERLSLASPGLERFVCREEHKAGLPSLRMLEICIRSNTELASLPDSVLSTVEHLIVHWDQDPSRKAHIDIHALSVLSLTCPSDSGLEELHELNKLNIPCLQTLEMRVRAPFGIAPAGFNMYIGGYARPPRHLVDQWLGFIKSLGHGATHVELQCGFGETASQWEPLDALLATGGVRGLKTVRCLQGGESHVYTAFPRCRAEGLLVS